ncbi:RlmE family RNA methyltransferase [Myxococcota bacterium]|nr:RlmE family RNA methyltransferase [Myxococcota bacterium]
MAYQRKDHFHQRAKREGYRSRAAYKLLEVQKRHRLLRRGQRVVDLGCWPGGWLQVAARAVGPRGRVVGVDVTAMEPELSEANAVALRGDLSDPALCGRILEELGARAEVMLSDAAPKLTGVRVTDRAREEELLLAVEATLPHLLKPGGDLLLKLLEGPEAQALSRRIGGCFKQAKTLRAAASRPSSTEKYLLARGFKVGSP